MKPTSIKAFKSKEDFAPAHRELIVTVLKRAKKPINYREIAERAKMEAAAVHRRIHELEESGIIVQAGFNRTPAGRIATTYIAA